MAEISGWSSLTPQQRRAVVDALEHRKATIPERETRSRNFRLPGS